MIDVNRFCPGCMGEATGDRYCNVCGYDYTSKNPVEALNVRFLLNSRYVIGKVLEQSSEGFTYLAFDTETNTPVDIKEYFPLGMSVRYPDKTVAAKSNVDSFYYNEGLLEFIDLNRKLSRLENVAIFPILSIFEDNGTAYSVMNHNTGITLSSFLERNGNILKWGQARPLFFPLIETIVTLNENGIIHGGISPESISVGRDGKLRLTNTNIIKTRFASENFATAIYPGCAAIEQYSAEKGNIGSFTDVYGIASTLFRVLLGTLPPPANERMNNDKMSISSAIAGDLPRQVLTALANGLQVKIGDRTQSIVKFRDELVYGDTYDNIQKAEARKNAQTAADPGRDISSNTAPAEKPRKNKSSSLKYAGIAAGVTAGLFIILIIGAMIMFPKLRSAVLGEQKSDTGNSSSSTKTSTSQNESEEDDTPVIDPSEKLYSVPELTGKKFAEVIEDKNKNTEDNKYENFKITISDRVYSSTYSKGCICSQSIQAGKGMPKDTEIRVVVSLGPEKLSVPDLYGCSEEEALLMLCKSGFQYNNIKVSRESYDPTKPASKVISQKPDAGKKLSPDESITIYVNSYTGPSETETEIGED
ncbi:MAG: PASTA domain-containing protein [Clostridia bacterium]|nr:PASTA domain-containing protein [Clostridia bacterium]